MSESSSDSVDYQNIDIEKYEKMKKTRQKAKQGIVKTKHNSDRNLKLENLSTNSNR